MTNRVHHGCVIILRVGIMNQMELLFQIFRDLPDGICPQFAKTITEKMNRCDYSPLSGLINKKVPSSRPTIKPYLLVNNSENELSFKGESNINISNKFS